MKTLILVILSLFIPHKKKSCMEMDVIVLVDISGSLSGYESYLNHVVDVLVSRMDMSENKIRIGIVTFSSLSIVKCHLTEDKNIVKSHIGKIISDDGSTDMISGLYTSLNELMNNGRQGTKKLIVVISDGATNNDDGVRLAAKQLSLANILICSVHITGMTSNRQLMRDISTGCYIESNYENLVKEIEKLDICI